MHITLYKLISFFNDENLKYLSFLSTCPGFDFDVEIGIGFANSDFCSVSHFPSEYSTIFTSSAVRVSSAKVFTKNKTVA